MNQKLSHRYFIGITEKEDWYFCTLNSCHFAYLSFFFYLNELKIQT